MKYLTNILKCKYYKILIMVCIMIAAVWGGYTIMQTVYMSIAEINANPSAISGKTLSGGRYKGLHLKDVTLKGTTFKDVWFDSPKFENVIFEDCIFINMYAYDMFMKDVLFKRGEFIQKDRDDLTKDNRGQFEGEKVENVVFDGAYFDGFYMNIGSGDVAFFNINQRLEQERALFLGGNVKIRIDKCWFTKRSFIVDPGALIYATNSTFKRAGFGASRAAAIYVENCTMLGGPSLGAADTLVVRNSKLDTGAAAQHNAYFVNNEYTDLVALLGDRPDTRFYLLHDKKTRGKINMLGGEFFVQNLEVVDGAIQGWEKKLPYITGLNFKDVIIRGGDWEDLHLKGGRWENVQIYPPVDVTNAVMETVQGYNVTFPKGSPWTEKAARTTPITTFPEGIPWRGKAARTIPITTEDKPFDWPEVRVPTPEELGLVWEWPEVTGAPRK